MTAPTLGGSTVGLSRFLIRAFMRMHTWVYRRSGGQQMGWVQGARVLLLSTTGRRSGRLHTVPLGSVQDGDNYVVVASNGGKNWHPAWWLNLQSNPEALIEMGSRQIAVVAQRAQDDECARLGPLFSWLQRYQERTQREIPVVILRLVA
ncbi:MAG: nitroreductase/quinone reductase family protein [Anaerolineales bacterium]|nr:nitroreductase/quinone reductase family protein [Anaerolineales bacterium]HJL70978.1 nitroreductase/quinone reductase family protein [Anaerolineales bacterium]HJN40553.1 nitroreductase/quinone reductase family protein [Anaerolineales bacterium]